MPLTLQAKRLRVLENGEVSRIGSNDTIKVDVRLIAATHRDLEAMIKEGKFRQDLFFRSARRRPQAPGITERKEDIPLLSAHFIKELTHRHGKKVTGIAEPVRKAHSRFTIGPAMCASCATRSKA